MTAQPPALWPRYESRTIESVGKLLRAGRTFDYKRGPEIAGFETEFAQVHGRRYALFVNSGTSALLSAYYGLGIGPGDEVICPDLTFPTSATPLFLLGATPVYCDVERATGNIDPAEVERHVTTATRAVVVTHLWGHPCRMDEIAQLCRKRSLLLVEDCSHAHGSRYDGRWVGTFGNAAAFSLGTSKMISGGLAGILVTDEREVYERACLLGHFQQRSELSVRSGRYARYCYSGLGANLRATPIAAVLAHSHLRTLERRIRAKTRNLERLRRGLARVPAVCVPEVSEGCTMGAWFGFKLQFRPFALRGVSKRAFMAALRAEGVEIEDYVYRPLHTLPTLANNGAIGSGGTSIHPVASELFRNGLTLNARRLHGECDEYIEQTIAAFEKVQSLADQLVRTRSAG